MTQWCSLTEYNHNYCFKQAHLLEKPITSHKQHVYIFQDTEYHYKNSFFFSTNHIKQSTEFTDK